MTGRVRPCACSRIVEAMPLRDTHDWFADLGGGVRVALVVAGHFRSDAGVLLGMVPRREWHPLVRHEIDEHNRLRQALNCLLIETSAGRVLVETGLGERQDDKLARQRGMEGLPILPALREAGFEPASVDWVALSHLHFDHAGGLLDRTGARAFPRARIVAQRAEWAVALTDNPRVIAGYVQDDLRVVAEFALPDAAEGERELIPGVGVVAAGGHTAGSQAIVVRGPAGAVAFFGDLCMRPWSANPTWLPSFDDFPLDSVLVKQHLFERAAEEGWRVVLSHEPDRPIGRVEREAAGFRYVPD
jgi:glyoxylase-like metal-dependent hydrolase (beta-lactamase superfamily II)